MVLHLVIERDGFFKEEVVCVAFDHHTPHDGIWCWEGAEG